MQDLIERPQDEGCYITDRWMQSIEVCGAVDGPHVTTPQASSAAPVKRNVQWHLTPTLLIWAQRHVGMRGDSHSGVNSEPRQTRRGFIEKCT
jgi:hypothetical protein